MNAMDDAAARRDEAAASEGASVLRHEEELGVTAGTRERAVRASKHVESEQVSEIVPRSVEHYDEIERAVPNAEDSGEVELLPDGSVSIPILEEELVIEKRIVVRERVVVRKRTETRHERVEAELRK
jgi:stress response protein YsnF